MVGGTTGGVGVLAIVGCGEATTAGVEAVCVEAVGVEAVAVLIAGVGAVAAGAHAAASTTAARRRLTNE